jgi:hypothetical protein
MYLYVRGCRPHPGVAGRRIPAGLTAFVVAIGAACGASAGADVDVQPAPIQAPAALVVAFVAIPARDQLPRELEQVAGVVAAAATPSEVLVLHLVSDHDPDDPTAPDQDVVADRAPSGPAPPVLVKLPRAPGSGATPYLVAQYQHRLAAMQTINRGKETSWRHTLMEVATGWRQREAARLRTLEASSDLREEDLVGEDYDIAGALAHAATVLAGLPGERVLVLLGGAGSGPPQAGIGRLTGIQLVIANLADGPAADEWRAAATGAGVAGVFTLDSTLTDLKLAQTVNEEIGHALS